MQPSFTQTREALNRCEPCNPLRGAKAVAVLCSVGSLVFLSQRAKSHQGKLKSRFVQSSKALVATAAVGYLVGRGISVVGAYNKPLLSMKGYAHLNRASAVASENSRLWFSDVQREIPVPSLP